MKAKIKMITAMLIFGSIGLFVKKAEISSGMLALVRGAVGTFFLLAASGVSGIWRAGKKDKTQENGNKAGGYRSLTAIKKNGILLLVSGAAIGINWICLFEAYRYTTIATATLCYYLAPVFVMLVSPIFLKERLTLTKIGCIMASLAGMVLVADLLGTTGTNSSNIKGIVFGVTAAVLYASVVVMNKFLKDIKAVDMTISQLGVAALVLVPYVFLMEDVTAMQFDMQTVILLLFVGIVHTGMAYLFYFGSLTELSGQTAALFSYIDPVTAILLSALLLHEPISGAQAIGAVLILGSTLLSEMGGSRKQI